MIKEWITNNAERYWLSKGGPLRPVEEGGADVVVVCFFQYSSEFPSILPPNPFHKWSRPSCLEL